MVHMNSIPSGLLVNMDETAIYFDTHHSYTVNERCAKTESVRRGTSANKRCTVCITVAADSNKLPLFVIFKGAVSGPIANSIPHIMSEGMFGCTQVKGWMYNRVMNLWKEKVWKPYLEGSLGSALLLDQMESHIHTDFIDTVDEFGTPAILIPGGFTSICEPCDDGIMKLFKTRLTELCQQWKVSEYQRLGGIGRIPIPGRAEVLQWLSTVLNEFPSNIIQNAFRKCGFTEDLDIDIDTALDLI